MAKKKAAAREATLDDLLSAGVRYRPLDEAPTQDTIAEPPSPSGLRRVGDVGLSLIKGAIGVPEAAVGMADLVTGGRVGKFLENEGGAVGFRPQQAKQQLDQWLSPQQQAANEEVNQAKGVVDTGMAALRNPSVIGHAVAESVPLMLGGGVIARALMKAAPISAVVAGSAGEGIAGAGMSASQIRQETPDRLLTPTQASLAAASGLATGALGYLGGRVAQKMGLVDIDTLIAGKAAPHVNRGFVRQLLQGAVAEGVLEELPQSVQEQVAQNLALDRPLDEGVDKAIVLGTLAGMAMGAGGQVAARSLGDQVRQQKMPESGALTRSANAPKEEAAKAADAALVAPAVDAEAPADSMAPPTDPPAPPSGGSGYVEDERWGGEYYGPGDTTNPVTGERIPAPPPAEPASPADELPAAPLGAKVDPDAALTRMERQLQREDAMLRFGGEPETPVEAAPAALEPAATDTEPLPEPTDIGRADGQPFANRLAASKRLKTAGDGYVIASVAGGYVLRKGSTDVADAVGDGGRGLADAGRSDGSERLRDGQPAALDVAAAPADGQAVAGVEPDGVRPLGSDDAVAEQNAEPPPAQPVAESLAPDTAQALETGDGEVATAQAAGGRISTNAAPPAEPAVATPEPGSPPQVGAAPAGADEPLNVAKPAQTIDAAPPPGDPISKEPGLSSFAGEPATPQGGAPLQAIEAAAHEAATSPNNDLPEPTDAMKAAGNYKLGHTRISGMDVSIENPKGSTRRSKADAPDPWEVTMPAHYGYIRGTKGSDGDHVDLFIGDRGDNGRFWVINQTTPDGKTFDEHKAVTGVDSPDEAVALYKASFSDGFGDKVFRSVSAEFNADQLKAVLPAMEQPVDVAGPAAEPQSETRSPDAQARTESAADAAPQSPAEASEERPEAPGDGRAGPTAQTVSSPSADSAPASRETQEPAAETAPPVEQADAAQPEAAAPEPAAQPTRNAALVEARKRLSVLNSLAKCLA